MFFIGGFMKFEAKECICFNCPLDDCRDPCPFGMDGKRHYEDVDKYLTDVYKDEDFKEKGGD